MNKKTREILEEQLQLLSDLSHETMHDESVSDISIAMRDIAQILENSEQKAELGQTIANLEKRIAFLEQTHEENTAKFKDFKWNWASVLLQFADDFRIDIPEVQKLREAILQIKSPEL